MDILLITQFWLVSLALAWTPGADWAFMISAGLRAKSPMPALAGILLGYAIVVLLVAVGIGALVTSVPLALTILTFVGAAYLLYLGITALRSKPEKLHEADVTFEPSALSQFLKGTGISALNPKGIILLVALLPQFTTRAAEWPLSLQMITLGATHIFNILWVYLIVGYSARALLRSRPRAQLWVTRASGLIMIAIAAGIVIEQVAALR